MSLVIKVPIDFVDREDFDTLKFLDGEASRACADFAKIDVESWRRLPQTKHDIQNFAVGFLAIGAVYVTEPAQEILAGDSCFDIDAFLRSEIARATGGKMP